MCDRHRQTPVVISTQHDNFFSITAGTKVTEKQITIFFSTEVSTSNNQLINCQNCWHNYGTGEFHLHHLIISADRQNSQIKTDNLYHHHGREGSSCSQTITATDPKFDVNMP